jgi:hypothetical protein
MEINVKLYVEETVYEFGIVHVELLIITGLFAYNTVLGAEVM